MKKIVSIFVLAMFIGCPMVGRADPVALDPQPVPNPTHTDSDNTTSVLPNYASETIFNTDQSGVASAAYVKGAYNDAIRSVNKVAAVKQNVLNSGANDTLRQDNGGGFVSSVSAANGVVTVNRVEVSVPVANSAPTISGDNRAAIWIQ